MAVTSGYFNSVNGDRKYNADQMSEYFEGIINEGVCQHIDGGLAVTAGTGLSVSVAAGKAFIGQKWIRNDAALTLTIGAASTSYARIDAVVVRRNNSTRTCEIAVKAGTPAASPEAPSMTRTDVTYEMALAYVNVAANATSVTVTDKRADTTVCGWATVAQATSGEVDQMLNDMKTGFDGVVYSSPAAMVQGEDQKLQNEFQSMDSAINAEISDRNTEIFGNLHTDYKPIPFVIGTSKSSSNKVIDVDIPIGEKYTVLLSDPNNCISGSANIALYEMDSQGNPGSYVASIKANIRKTITASKDVKGFSLYLDGSNVISTGIASIIIYSDYIENGQSIEEMAKNATQKSTFDKELYGDMAWEIIPTVNGSFSASGLTVNIPNRLRTDAIPVKIGDKIVIDNGSLKHSCGAWNGSISSANIVRNDASWITEDETIVSTINGYYVIVFAKQDQTQNITASDFDGEITDSKSNLAKLTFKVSDLENEKVDKTGNKQIKTNNLYDVDDNLLAFEEEHILTGTGEYVYEVIYRYTGPFVVGDVFTIGAESVIGATASNPFVIYLSSGGTSITQVGNQLIITQEYIDAGLDMLGFGLRPAVGVPLPTGEATYTNVYIVKGEEIEYTLSGSLKSAVENVVGQLSADIPNYYMTDDYLQNKANRINSLAADADDVLLFITDVHWEMNAKHSPELINYLSKKCNIPRLFDGGDLANGINKVAIEQYKKSYNGGLHRAVGNHDRFPPVTGKNLYYAFDILNNDQFGNAFNHYYFVDNVQQKIRYIILNAFYHDGDSVTTGWSYYDADQISWFSSIALNVQNDWDVVVITHFLKTSNGGIPGSSDIELAIDNFNADSSRDGQVIAVLQGHSHWDAIYHTNGGVPIITTTCDKWDLSNESDTIPAEGIAFREFGTIKEQAFDVMILNRENKTITAVRIGAPAQDNVDKFRTDSGFTWIGTLQERTVSYDLS